MTPPAQGLSSQASAGMLPDDVAKTEERKRSGGPSGAHRNPQRLLSQDPEDFAAQDAAARADGVSWADWMRDAARQKLARSSRARAKAR